MARRAREAGYPAEYLPLVVLPRSEWHDKPVPTVTAGQLMAENRALRADNARLVRENRNLRLRLRLKDAVL